MFWTWEQYLTCCCGIIKNGDEKSEIFGKSWPRRASPLLWRVPILLWAVITILWSAVEFWGPLEKFFLYMTHWGLLLIVLESAFGIIVTIKKSYGAYPETSLELPWYVKTYWVLYNITIPVSFLVTMFYWGILKSSTKVVNYAPNQVLDVMVHGANSLVMFVELISSAHPSRLLHIMQPLFFALAYLLFTVIYYYAGGDDPWGNHFIYPVIDWSKPKHTIVVVTLTALFLALMHIVVVAIATLRDFIAARCLGTSKTKYVDSFAA